MESRMVFFLLLSCGLRSCYAWGVDGHEMVCSIAQSMFEGRTAEAVGALLQPYFGIGDFAFLCPWADWAAWGDRGAPYYPWSKHLHYADSPCSEATCFGGTGGGNCLWHYKVDCPCQSGAGNGDGECVAGAINNYTRQLTAFESLPLPSHDDSLPRRLGPIQLPRRRSEYNLTEALLFVAHLVGDSHQPLHAGFKSDKGGNMIRTECDFCGKGKRPKHENLHAVWDDGIIDHAIRAVYANKDHMLATLIKRVSDGGVYASMKQEWISCGDQQECSSTYVDESEKLACRKAYVDERESLIVPGAELDVGYYNSRLPVVELRLAQAGVRLAQLLNTLFAEKSDMVPQEK